MDARPDQHRPPPLHRRPPVPVKDDPPPSNPLVSPNLDLHRRHLHSSGPLVPPGPVDKQPHGLHADIPQIEHDSLLHLLRGAGRPLCVPPTHGSAGVPLPQDIPKDSVHEKRLGYLLRDDQRSGH